MRFYAIQGSIQRRGKHKNRGTGRFVFLAGNWYMVAFCHLRNDYRHFRCDRILDLRPTLQPHSKNHPSHQRLDGPFFATGKRLDKSCHRHENKLRSIFGGSKFYSGFVEEIPMGDFTRLVFLTQSINGFARWMMMFAGSVQIIEPQALKDEMMVLAKNIINSHQPC